MSYLIYGILSVVFVLALILIGAFLYSLYIVIFKSSKEYIKYGDRYVLRFRDKKTGRFM